MNDIWQNSDTIWRTLIFDIGYGYSYECYLTNLRYNLTQFNIEYWISDIRHWVLNIGYWYDFEWYLTKLRYNLTLKCVDDSITFSAKHICHLQNQNENISTWLSNIYGLQRRWLVFYHTQMIDFLQKCCQWNHSNNFSELMANQKLQNLLYMVLVAGNFLNSGGYAGNSYSCTACTAHAHAHAHGNPHHAHAQHLVLIPKLMLMLLQFRQCSRNEDLISSQTDWHTIK